MTNKTPETWYINTVKPAQTTTFIKRPRAINDHFYSPPTIYTIYFNWIQRLPKCIPKRPLQNFFSTTTNSFAWWAYNKNGETDRGCSPKVTFIFRIRKPEVIFFVPKIMFSLLLSFLTKNMFIFLIFLPFWHFRAGLKFIKWFVVPRSNFHGVHHYHMV
jgi:hypothetical protein